MIENSIDDRTKEHNFKQNIGTSWKKVTAQEFTSVIDHISQLLIELNL